MNVNQYSHLYFVCGVIDSTRALNRCILGHVSGLVGNSGSECVILPCVPAVVWERLQEGSRLQDTPLPYILSQV